MAARVRGITRVLQRLSPLPAARIPHSQPAIGVSGRTTSARNIMVGTIMHDDTGGMFSYERVHLWSTWLLFSSFLFSEVWTVEETLFSVQMSVSLEHLKYSWQDSQNF